MLNGMTTHRHSVICRILLIGLLLSTAGGTHAQTIDEVKAMKIKAGCIYHLCKLVTWPTNSGTWPKPPKAVPTISCSS